ncbi:MAG: alkaline phosphatase family protein [Chitinophagaceae bacterium]|nr:alkaline phosphatase family protein [Chitinophagaceae bacterium]
MKFVLYFFFGLITCFSSFSQTQKVEKPKIVIGIMVDQMRWDFLYRFEKRYSSGGFKRLVREGFSCDNAYIPYAQTVTAAGHSTVYTGSVPAISGIMGNDWYDRSLGKSVYCAEDASVKTIGGSANAQPMSPKNLQVTTVCDEQRIATNFKSKTIGIAIKDRGGILPAGQSANAAYWYDASTGNWVSSTYYMNELPLWAKSFNDKKTPDSLFNLGWNTLYPVNTYVLSDEDDKSYEGKSSADSKPVFPHNIAAYAGKNYGALSSTPHGNTLTLSFAKAAIEAEGLGNDEYADFLAISFSSPDYIGHQYGPNSIEVEDNYLRLDKELEAFFIYLDKKFGKNYTVFLTADHGVAHAPGYSKEKKIPGGNMSMSAVAAAKNTMEKFKISNLVESFDNYQYYLNYKKIDSAGADLEAVKKYFIKELNKDPSIFYAFDIAHLQDALLPEVVKNKYLNGYHPKLSGDVQIILKAGYLSGSITGSSHGSWYPYDAHIPMVFMGAGINKGRTTKNTSMSDFAPTLAALLKIQMPSGNVGDVISEAIK